MTKIICSEVKPGRRFFGSLTKGEDLITSIGAFCKEMSIQMATFSTRGAVSSVTLGIYDQNQQVFVTHKETSPQEIVTCSGNVSLKDGKPAVSAHIILSNAEGELIGGHLFSQTIVFAGEIDIREWFGNRMERAYDPDTGLLLWKRLEETFEGGNKLTGT